MRQSRRRFLKSATLTLGAASVSLGADSGLRSGDPGRQPGDSALQPAKLASESQVPRMRFGGVEISRLVAGCNPFYGYAHFNSTLATIMREYYTADRVCDVLHQCARFGINAYNYVQLGRAAEDLQRFVAEGGRMHLIVQVIGDAVPIYKQWKPLAMYHHGERTDRAFQEGKMGDVREWCRKTRDLGTLVGVGTHKPEVIAMVEEQGWDVDFYAGCVYNRTRTAEEWRRVLNGQLLEMPGEIYLQSDPARMYATMRQTRKPCFAFKILAAGRIAETGADQAFETAFASLKPTDGVFIGLFPKARDEVRENAERVCRILGKGTARTWGHGR